MDENRDTAVGARAPSGAGAHGPAPAELHGDRDPSYDPMGAFGRARRAARVARRSRIVACAVPQPVWRVGAHGGSASACGAGVGRWRVESSRAMREWRRCATWCVGVGRGYAIYRRGTSYRIDELAFWILARPSEIYCYAVGDRKFVIPTGTALDLYCVKTVIIPLPYRR
jgi:hypothetical protein